MRYIFILLILTSSCITKKPLSEQIIGFWYYCQPNGTYHEVHIFEGRFSTHFGTLPFNPYDELEYSLTADTVTFELKNWNPGTVKAKIKVIDKDQISWQIVNADTTFAPQLLTRIPFEIQLKPESDSVSLYDWSNEQFQTRIKRIACSDLRTPEQIYQDSIDQAEIDAFIDSLDFL
ncbi:hypothetical protein [Marinoscillum sp. MHG1-6]|uniref:hypothetical protein n=1 Tax=Marinoscillum sp. MHG1-6 TaxID=2959627 RepID=UPI0021584A12|nr:hypothetical protein [Marinoscillum sp. MHG1-6]